MPDRSKPVALIEDRYTTKIRLAERIKSSGYKVLAFQYDKALLKNLAGSAPAIIVTDLAPSKSAPFGLFKSIRSNKMLEKTEIFFFGERLDVKIELELRRFGITSFFIKSPKAAPIIAAIKRYFDPIEEETVKDWEARLERARRAEIFGQTLRAPMPTEEPTPPKSAPSRPKESPPSASAGKSNDARAPTPKSERASDSIFKSDLGSAIGVNANDVLASFFDKDDETDETQQAESNLEIGIARARSGDVGNAIKALKLAAENDSTRAKANLALGKLYLKIGKYSGAINLLQDGAKREKGALKLSYHYELGRALESLKKPDQALKLYRSIGAVDANFKDVKSRISRLARA